MKGFNERLANVPSSKIRAFFELVQEQENILSLGVGEPDIPAFWTIREEAISCLEKGQTYYSSNAGLPELREAIAHHYLQFSPQYYLPKDQVLVCNGASEAIDICLRALINPGDEVILPQPIYVCYEPLLQLLGAKVQAINTAPSFIPCPKAIEKAISPKTKLLVLCYPNNPTGKSIPKDTLAEIYALCKKHAIKIIADEIYAEVSFDQQFCSIAHFDKDQSLVAIVNGFSKAYAMTGLRVGYVLGPKDWIGLAAKIHQYSALCANTISQYAAIEALKNGNTPQKKFVASLKTRGEYMAARFNAMGLDTQKPDGGLYCFTDISSLMENVEDFATELLKQQKVAVIPGSAFGSYSKQYIRSCFACPQDKLKSALDAIESFVKTLKNA